MQLYINIDVDDVDKAVTFYTEGLGLQLSRRQYGWDGSPRWATHSGTGCV